MLPCRGEYARIPPLLFDRPLTRVELAAFVFSSVPQHPVPFLLHSATPRQLVSLRGPAQRPHGVDCCSPTCGDVCRETRDADQ